jgi:hypothetical protein
MTKYESLKILGLQKLPSSQEELKHAFRDLAKENHPDLGGDPNHFLLIQDAYQHLSQFTYKTRPIRTTVSENSIDVVKMGRLLISGSIAQIRVFAARQLGESSKKSAYAYLKYGFSDLSQHVRIESIRASAKLGIRQSLNVLRPMLKEVRGDEELEIVQAILHLEKDRKKLVELLPGIRSKQAYSLVKKALKEQYS